MDTKSLFNQILWLNFLFPRFPCPSSFQKMHNIYIQKAPKTYQSLPDRTCQTKDSKVELWINWRKQENSTPWVGRAFGNILLLEGLPAVYTCCREPFHNGEENSKFIFFFSFIRHFWTASWPTEAQRRRMPVKTFDNTIIKTKYGIDQYHRRRRLKNCADYFFCSFDFSTFDQEKEEEETDFQTFMWINDKFGLIWWSFLSANVNIFGH